MRVVLGSLALLVLASCDPPPPSYPQYRYGNDPSQDPNPPPQYSNDPNAPPSTYPQQPPPPPQGQQQPPPGYTTTSPQPGYTTTVVPGYSGPPPQAPAGGPPPPQTQPPPGQLEGYPGETSPAPPPPSSPSSIAAGQYACWQVGMGGYVASTLVSVNLNPDGTYQVAGYKNAGGNYRTDTVSVYLSGGPLNGWVGAIGANAKGPLVRFRPDAPNNPGNEMHQGDHLCFLHF